MFLEFGNTIYELTDSFFSSEKQQQKQQQNNTESCLEQSVIIWWGVKIGTVDQTIKLYFHHLTLYVSSLRLRKQGYVVGLIWDYIWDSCFPEKGGDSKRNSRVYLIVG